jgi:CheY-like chemotaxis protein/anti-sigma regulatory factor (Ser/Thr protein kinase)
MIPSSIELDVEVDDDLWPAVADPAQLQQALLNLAANARDALPEHGRITIHVRNREFEREDRGTAGATRRGRFVEFAVHDTGAGIDPDTRERMFDPFFTTKEVGQGRGLGLAVVYGLVQSHGGWVDVESKPGEGTSIYIYFPVAQGEVVTDAPAVRVAEGGRETILLADDDEMVRRLICSNLERLGYRVFEARDGDEAVDVFKQNPEVIALALLDLTMPRRDGLAALEEIRTIVPDLPAVLVSGFVSTSDRVRSAGDVELLAKPFDGDELARAVRAALDKRDA